MDKLNKTSQVANYISSSELRKYFDFIMANAIRTKLFPTVLMIRMIENTSSSNKTDLSYQSTESLALENTFGMENIDRFLMDYLRDSDLLAQTDEHERTFVLMNSGENEAKAFVNRLFHAWNTGPYANEKINFSACIIEVNKKVSLDEVVQAGTTVLDQSTSIDTSELQVCDIFAGKEHEIVKISLIESNENLRHFVKMKLENMTLDFADLSLEVFSDGYDFLQSDWYKSSHQHVVILNDIMPKMNGYDVLHALRNEPNERRYRILMMTERAIEDIVVSAYDGGLDEFIKKPFKMDILEAKIKRLIERY